MILFPLLIFVLSQEGVANEAIARASSREVTLTGFTRPRAEFDLVVEVEGRCKQVFYDVGEEAENEVFAKLNPVFTELDLAANLNEQKRLSSRLAFLEKEVTRYRDLLAQETISQAVFDDFEQQRDQVALELNGLKVREGVYRTTLDLFIQKIPVGWRVIERQIEPGQWVGKGTIIGSVGDFRSLLVPLSLDNSELKRLRETQDLMVSLPEWQREVPARIARISPAFDATTRKTLVELELSEGMVERRGGIRVELTLAVSTEDNVFELPEAALKKVYDAYWVQPTRGERIRVAYLGKNKNGLARVRSKEIKAGDRFKLGPVQ